jgi:hypothetical protein
MPELGLSLGLWQGTFRDIPKLWLRWFTLTGELIPEPTEEAIEAKGKVEQLTQLLRDLGVNPDTLDNA